MLDLISSVGWSVLTNVIQLAAGSILAVIVYRFLAGKYAFHELNLPISLLVITVSSFAGLLLPLGIYGVIPLALMLLAAGISADCVLPFVFSNAMFNMLVSITNQSFSWKTGFGRIIFAFTAGIAAGVVFKFMNSKKDSLIRFKTSSFNVANTNIESHAVAFFSENTNTLGLYLIGGAILNALFQKYLLEYIVNIIFINSSFSRSLSFILVFDIANPFILSTFNLFVNFTSMAAFARFLKFKALAVFVVTYFVLALLFSIAVLL